jgi:hypothetical protein
LANRAAEGADWKALATRLHYNLFVSQRGCGIDPGSSPSRCVASRKRGREQNSDGRRHRRWHFQAEDRAEKGAQRIGIRKS